MLEYNDALAYPQQQATTECCVCKHHYDPATVIWHTVRLNKAPSSYEVYRTTDTELVVPICFHCADLFHDVKPSKSTQEGL